MCIFDFLKGGGGVVGPCGELDFVVLFVSCFLSFVMFFFYALCVLECKRKKV